ncbi:MAG: hypothetical protein HN353_10265 [Bdellovibrionales bacterium]|jgi:hypothetical protein|nr:hypothetical protein [Bdellovibrionales bacterium]MBT3527285.1 hypothetical protein [Bdellovibrionales bacterium]MBT7765954.1 hypothetical protein [Bdellovibrionales bacterium]
MRLMFTTIIISISFAAHLLASDTSALDYPRNCFTNEDFCTVRTVERNGWDKFVRVDLYASFPGELLSSPQELLDFFFDFGSWQIYTADSEIIDIQDSKQVPVDPTLVIGGEGPIVQHYSHYFYRGLPFPVYSMEVRDLSRYQVLHSDESSAVVKYHSVDGHMEIPGARPLDGPEGLTHKEGFLRIDYDANTKRYILQLRTDLTPLISLGLSITGGYVEKGIIEIYQGMAAHALNQ